MLRSPELGSPILYILEFVQYMSVWRHSDCEHVQETNHPSDSFLYGDCVFTTPDDGSMALTNVRVALFRQLEFCYGSS